MEAAELTFKNQTVVVTGGSSGVGLATAEAFAKAGAHVVIAARGSEGLNEAKKRLEQYGTQILAVETDMGVAEQVKHLAEEARKLTGSLDIWVNNAGVMASGKFEEIPNEVNEGVIRTNLMGYLHGAYFSVPIFKEQNRGILINNVSIGGYVPAPFSAVYSATKFGIRGLMTELEAELRDYTNIHVANVYPQIQDSTGNAHSAKFSGLEFSVPPFAGNPEETAKCILKVAQNPKLHNYPGPASYMITQLYKLFPKLALGLTTKALKVNMKVADGPETQGNVLEPSDGPHRIHAESSTGKVAKKLKIAAPLVAGLAIGLYALRSRK